MNTTNTKTATQTLMFQMRYGQTTCLQEFADFMAKLPRDTLFNIKIEKNSITFTVTKSKKGQPMKHSNKN